MKTFAIAITLLAFTFPLGFADSPDGVTPSYKGQPVTSSMSPDDAIGFINHTISMWVASKLPDRSPKMQPAELLTFANSFRQVGIANLIAAYEKTAPDDLYRVNAVSNPQEGVKRGVLDKALSLTATPADIPAILQTYDSSPLILAVFLDHPEWDNDPHVVDFLNTHLDTLQDAYKISDTAPAEFLNLVIRNPSTAIQTKFDAVLTDAAVNSYHNTHFYIDLISVYGLTGNKQIVGHFADILTVLAGKASETQPSDTYNDVAAKDVLVRLTWLIVRAPIPNLDAASRITALFSDQKSKDAINKLVRAVQQNETTPDFHALIPSAVCGDKSALVRLVDLYQNPGSSTDPGTPQGSSDLAHNYIKAYLDTIVSQMDGDKLKNVIYHVNSATYDPATCVWTIPAAN